MTRALDAGRRRYAVGDLVVTTKRSWFGPGIVGDVVEITSATVSVATNLTIRGRVTVRHHHVLRVRRRTGIAVQLRQAWTRLRELNRDVSP